jgi:hypothetical protein
MPRLSLNVEPAEPSGLRADHHELVIEGRRAVLGVGCGSVPNYVLELLNRKAVHAAHLHPLHCNVCIVLCSADDDLDHRH